MRQIVLDTETTGLSTAEGHRIIEIGCVELVNRRLTGRTFHRYINPDREVDLGAFQVHGISNEFLADKPYFDEIAAELLDFLRGAELIIHNAAFDVGFLDYEFKKMDAQFKSIMEDCSILDTLLLARQKHPGQQNSLDALCRRYQIDNSNREFHGALLDAKLLSDVYLAITGGQTSLFVEETSTQLRKSVDTTRVVTRAIQLPVIMASEEEIQTHLTYLERMKKSNGGKCIWGVEKLND